MTAYPRTCPCGSTAETVPGTSLAYIDPSTSRLPEFAARVKEVERIVASRSWPGRLERLSGWIERNLRDFAGGFSAVLGTPVILAGFSLGPPVILTGFLLLFGGVAILVLEARRREAGRAL